MSDPTAPTQIGGYGGTFRVRHAALKDGYLLCAQRVTYSSLWVLDVSDPTAVGSVRTVDLSGTSWDIAVNGNVAYLSAGSYGVHILDVTDPAGSRLPGRLRPRPTAPTGWRWPAISSASPAAAGSGCWT